MEVILSFASLVGSWFLVLGSVYQASLELKEQTFESDRIQSITNAIEISRHVSRWWWLLPPVKVFLESKRSKEYRHAYFRAMTVEERETFIIFTNKATGWLFVSLGGLLIALSETYTTVKMLHLPDYVFGIASVVFLFLALTFTVTRSSRTDKILK